MGGMIMALIKCPECGKEISDNAQNCPQCGYPLKGSATKGEDNPSIGTAKGSQQTSQPVPKKKKNGCLVGCLTFFIIFAVLIFIISSVFRLCNCKFRVLEIKNCN